MIGLASAAVLLLYLGRALAWIWGSKPLELADILFLVPIVIGVLLVCRRSARTRSRPSPAGTEVIWSDDAIRVPQIKRSNQVGVDERENLRQLQEWAAADYPWWKR